MSDETVIEGGTVLAGFVRELPAFVELNGHSLHPFARAVGLDVSDFSSLTKRISLDALCRLLSSLATNLNHETLGFDYGRHRTGGASGAFGQGFISAPTIKDMLLFYTKYIGTVVDHRFFEAAFERQTVTITWDYSPLVSNTNQFVDAAVSSFIRVLDAATQGRQVYKAFHLRRSQAEMPTACQKAYPGRVTFENKANSVVLATDTLSFSNPFANDVAFELMQTECEKTLSLARTTKPLVSILKEEIIESLAAGPLPIADAARKFGMSVRTLQRRLADQNLTYDGLVDSIRFGFIEKKLKHSDEPLGLIAFAAGYSEQSSFTRSVKKRFGFSPSELRRQGKSD